MPFCPVCQSEFRKDFTRCNQCDADLVETIEPEMELSEDNIRKALEGKELVSIAIGSLDVMQETRQLLASHRIASVLVEDSESRLPAGHAPRVKLLVGNDDIDGTARVLGDSFKQMLEVEGVQIGQELSYDRCPACKTLVAEDANECPECGLFIDKI